MTELEQARLFSQAIDRMLSEGLPLNIPEGSEDEADFRLARHLLGSVFPVDGQRQAGARRRLNQQFVARRGGNRLHFQATGVLRAVGLAFLALTLVAGLSWLIRGGRPQPVGVPTASPTPQTTPSVPAATATPPLQPSSTAGISPQAKALVEGTCSRSVDELSDPNLTWSSLAPKPEGLVDGAVFQVGNYTLELGLVCDPRFSASLANGDEFSSLSEIAGLGILTSWSYPGPWSVGGYTEISGIEPYVLHQGGGGSGGSAGPDQTISDTGLRGIQFPTGILPDFSQSDVRLRYVFNIQGPDGTTAGAFITFTLQREPSGYRPVDVIFQVLSESELQAITGAHSTQTPPFPLEDPYTLYPELGQVRDLLALWQAPLRSSAGWVHLLDRIDNPESSLYPGVTEYNNEQWLLLDEGGNVTASVYTDLADDGRILQQAYTLNGQGANLTYGSSSIGDIPLTTSRFDLGKDLLDTMLGWLRSGKPLDRQAETIDGRPAWVFTFTSMFNSPFQLGQYQVAASASREGIDSASGARLFSENSITTPDGQKVVTYRVTYHVAERVSEPPSGILAVLGQAPAGYSTPTPAVVPTLPGFDAADLDITYQAIPGDDAQPPTFYYGDLYAGSSLLGRVDFGATPGGTWCTRSTDGSLFAFLYDKVVNSINISSLLRWFDIHDVNTVHHADDTLQVNSFLAWSPASQRLAFTGCRSGKQDCGLYVLDASSGDLNLVSTSGTTLWVPLWSPDGTQVAFVDAGQQQGTLYTMYVVDVDRSQVVYQGLFDPDLWLPPAGSPLEAWGENFAREWSGDCYAGGW